MVSRRERLFRRTVKAGLGPEDILLDNDTIPVSETVVGILTMVGGTPPPTFVVLG